MDKETQEQSEEDEDDRSSDSSEDHGVLAYGLVLAHGLARRPDLVGLAPAADPLLADPLLDVDSDFDVDDALLDFDFDDPLVVPRPVPVGGLAVADAPEKNDSSDQEVTIVKGTITNENEIGNKVPSEDHDVELFKDEGDEKEVTFDELQLAKEGDSILEPIVKELQTTRSDVLMKLQKLFLIMQEKQSLLSQLQITNGDSEFNRSPLAKEVQEWSLLLQQAQSKLLNPLGSQMLMDNISTLEQHLQEERCQRSGYEIELRKLNGRLTVCEQENANLKADKKKLIEKAFKMKQNKGSTSFTSDEYEPLLALRKVLFNYPEKQESTQHKTGVKTAETLCPELKLTSAKQEVDIFHLLLNKLALLKSLNISGCNITDQGADFVAAVVLKASSLEELDISYTNLNAPNCFKISETLKTLPSLRFLRMNGNINTPEATESMVAAINSNYLIEELEFSNNELSSVSVVTILSKNKRIKLLDISKNRVSISKIENLSSALTNFYRLQELNLSQNMLMFTGVIQIGQALRGHSNLKYLNLEKNTISFFSECEFLVDVLLSINQSLLYLNVCGRNIRPRFVKDHMTPPCSHEKYNNFIVQNLYLSQYLLMSSITKSFGNHQITSESDAIIKATETCPITGEDISSYYVDHNGGTFYNTAHNFVIIVPPGAVSHGECVQIQATGSRFGPYELPDGYYPISNFFWVSAHYTFKIPVYLILSHHASPRSVSDLSKLHAMESCTQNMCTTAKGKLVMNKLVDGVFFDNKIGHCMISTKHFCSHCLAKDDSSVPDKFLASYFKYNSSGLLYAEVCICHANKECIEEVQKQYKAKKTKIFQPFVFSFNSQQSLTVKVDPEEFSGWRIAILPKEIHHEEFDFRHYEKDTLQMLESICVYPPRFVVTYQRNNPSIQLSSKITVSTGVKVIMEFIVNDDSDAMQVTVHDNCDQSVPSNLYTIGMLDTEPEMGDLITIVIPTIKAYWEDVAYLLRFKINDVDAIKEKHNDDPKKCCQQLFKDWLSTNKGVTPKTWPTLLAKLGKVEYLVAVIEEIKSATVTP